MGPSDKQAFATDCADLETRSGRGLPRWPMQETRWAYAGSGLVLYGEPAGTMREADSYYTMSALGLHRKRARTMQETRSYYAGNALILCGERARTMRGMLFPHTLCAFPDLWKCPPGAAPANFICGAAQRRGWTR